MVRTTLQSLQSFDIMNSFKTSFDAYGSFHEDLILGIDRTPSDVLLKIQRLKLADTPEERVPIRNATLKCFGVEQFEFTKRRELVEYDSFANVDLEIVDIVYSGDCPKEKVEIFWEGFLDGDFFEDSKFEILAREFSLEFADVV